MGRRSIGSESERVGSPLARAARVGLIYAAVGSVWILGSDTVLDSLITDPDMLIWAQILKGWVFIGITAVMLVVVLYRQFRSDAQLLRQSALQRRDIHGLSQFRESVIDNASIWINAFDPKAQVTVWNKAAERISGYRRDEVLGRSEIWRQLYPDDAERARITGTVMRILDEGIEVEGYETRIRCRDGQHKIIAWNSRRFLDDSGDIGCIAIGQDITDRKRMERELEQLAERDPLTGLYNRRKMEAMVRAEMIRAQRHDRSLTLLWIDIDHFKEINDKFGHLAGDAALRRVSERVQQHIRDVDLAARYGGDELVVALLDTSATEAMALAHRLQERVQSSQLLTHAAGTTLLTISIGVATFPEDGSDLEQLHAAADAAMYAAKRAGRNRVRRAHDGDSSSSVSTPS